MRTHPSHKTRISFDASSYDEICDLCGATDGLFTLGSLSDPCPNAPACDAVNTNPIVEWDQEVKPDRSVAYDTTLYQNVLREVQGKFVGRYDPEEAQQRLARVGEEIRRMMSKLLAVSQRSERWLHLWSAGIAVIERRYGVSISLSTFVMLDMMEGEQPTGEITITPTE